MNPSHKHRERLRKILLSCFVIFIGTISLAQNLETIGVKQGVKLNGSLNLSAVGYKSWHVYQRRDPLNWFVTGNLNVNIFGYNAPFSFSYSNANKSYSQPFNQFSFAPQYKWVKTYLGYNSMTFSPYTLAGHVFFGGGIELTPGNWSVAVMYGRLRKVVPFDLSDSTHLNNASFKRIGYGVKIQYNKNGNAIGMSAFTAKDDPHSIPFVLPAVNLAPMQNVALSVNLRKMIAKRFFIDAEYGLSVLNKDVRANLEKDTIRSVAHSKNLIQGLLPENPTSRYFDALRASVGYQGNSYGIQLKYERIAPEYQSLGAYYFNNDMRNLTVAPSLRLFQNKLNISANAGIQKNNLDHAKASTTSRRVGSFNLNFTPSEKWTLSSAYSNFTTYTNIRPLADPYFQNKLDTLNFYQISQTTNATVVRNWKNTRHPQSLMLTMSYQKSNNQATYKGANNQKTDFFSTNLSYTLLFSQNTNFIIAANSYITHGANTENTYFGPSLGLNRSLLAKSLRLGMMTTYNETHGNSRTSPVLNNRFSLNYQPKAPAGNIVKQSLAISINFLSQLKCAANQRCFSELTGTITYTYAF